MGVVLVPSSMILDLEHLRLILIYGKKFVGNAFFLLGKLNIVGNALFHNRPCQHKVTTKLKLTSSSSLGDSYYWTYMGKEAKSRWKGVSSGERAFLSQNPCLYIYIICLIIIWLLLESKYEHKISLLTEAMENGPIREYPHHICLQHTKEDETKKFDRKWADNNRRC